MIALWNIPLAPHTPTRGSRAARRKAGWLSTCLVLVVTSVGSTASPPARSMAAEPIRSLACNSALFSPRDFDDTNNGAAVGRAGVMRTPTQSGFTGWGTGKPSMATIWLDAAFPANDYVGMGWYVGSHSQLPYSSQPRVFYIERDISNPAGYRRSAGPNIGWASYHTLSIWDHNPGSEYRDFYFYVDGTFRGSTVILHNRFNHPSFEGRVYNDCTEMDSRAHKSASPWATLSYLTRNTSGVSTSHLFDDETFIGNAPYSIYAVHGQATALAWGPIS